MLKGGTVSYNTTDSPEKFNQLASLFLQEDIDAQQVKLE